MVDFLILSCRDVVMYVGEWVYIGDINPKNVYVMR